MTRRSILFLVALFVTPAYAQNNTSDTSKLIEVLQLKSGDTVAEIGAGGGELTLAIAKHVAPTGRVYTSELGSDRISTLRNAITRSGIDNVQVIEGQAAHANLPDDCCEAVFMRNVYHHFGDPVAMNASILKGLKPGGRVAVIDFTPRRNAAIAPPGKRGEDTAHGVSVEVVSNELKAAGFQIVTTEDRGERGDQREFLVVGVKPR